MKIAYRYFSLFLTLVLLTLPAVAEPGVASDYSNFTEDETYTNSPVENITFLTDSSESELFPVWTADGNSILYTVHRDGSDNLESYKMKANGSEIERTGIGRETLPALAI